MPTDVGTVKVQPGIDTKSQAQDLQQNVAAIVSNITGTPLESAQVAPPSTQSPVDQSVKDLAEEPKTEVDLQEFIDAERGRPRTDPSRNFLKVFLGRLRKKNPGSVIKQEE